MNFKKLASIRPTNLLQQRVLNSLSALPKGKYALLPSKNGETQVLQLMPSNGTDYFKKIFTKKILFTDFSESNLFTFYHVPLNACPIDSDTQDFAKALVFAI